MVTIDAILLGGGVGKRFSESNDEHSSPIPKQFRLLGQAPVFVHAVKALVATDCLRQIVFAVPKAYVRMAEDQIDSYLSDLKIPIRVVVGGERRQDSSRLAIEALENVAPIPTRVLIHDACRPYLSRSFLERIRTALFDRSYGAWVPVVPVVETLKRIENHQVTETVDRGLVHRVQTPQIFEYTVIRSLVQKVQGMSELNFTDDASLCEYYGIPVGVFEGDVRNVKLTYDFEMQALGSMLAHDRREDETCASELATTFTV